MLSNVKPLNIARAGDIICPDGKYYMVIEDDLDIITLVKTIRCVRIGTGKKRLKVHKPAFENRLRHCLKGFVHAVVQFNFVIQAGKGGGDGALLGEGRRRNFQFFQKWNSQVAHSCSSAFTPCNLALDKL